MIDAETDLRNAIFRQSGDKEYAARRAKEICAHWGRARSEVVAGWDKMMADWGERMEARHHIEEVKYLEKLAAKRGYRVIFEPIK